MIWQKDKLVEQTAKLRHRLMSMEIFWNILGYAVTVSKNKYGLLISEYIWLAIWKDEVRTLLHALSTQMIIQY